MLQKIESFINRLMDIIGILAGVLLIVLVFLIAWNVISRYAFQASSIGLEELAWHLYSAIFLLGIAYAMRSGSHVRVDIIYEKLTMRTRAIIDLAGSVIFLIPLCFIVIKYGWDFTAEAYKLGEKSQDPGGLSYRWIIKAVIPLSFLLLLLATASFIIHKINVLRGVEKPDETDASSHEHHIKPHLDAAKKGDAA